MPSYTPTKALALLKKGEAFSPVYFLQGEEVYYIDLITDYLQAHALEEAEKAFNLSLIYGKEQTISNIIAQAKQYPLMGNRQLLIVKEAQELSDLQRESGQTAFINYLHKPNPATILALAYKYKTIASKAKLSTQLAEKAFLVTAKKLYGQQLSSWIKQYTLEKGLTITGRAVYWLQELAGNDLCNLANELDKVGVNLLPGDQITDAIIQSYVGLHKPFNVFDLQKAIARRDSYKAYQLILQGITASGNQVAIPLVGILCTFFTKLLLLHYTQHKTLQEIAKALEINNYFVPSYVAAAQQYPVPKIIQNIGHLQEADKQLKGIGYTTTAEIEILKELVYKLLNG
jgi:DNA polymerase-3 subunit delta